MAQWVYRCEVEYTDPDDGLRKGTTTVIRSVNDLPDIFVVNASLRRAARLLHEYRLKTADRGTPTAELDLEVVNCTRRYE